MVQIINRIIYSDIFISVTRIHTGCPMAPQLMGIAKDILNKRKA